MPPRPKILLLDDDQDLLDLYKEILSQLPSKPEIHTASSGARAIALLDSEPFSLLISDLNMPKMDGLQVLSIVRRKFPQLRIVVMTSVMDEQFRSRSYAMGVDLFWQKPSTMEEIKLFLECIESLMGREELQGGFRGVQSKSLVDIIQLECLSRSSSVLRILNGALEGRIWVQDGDLIDATTQNLAGEGAFREILSWKTGSFEILPADPTHPRQIHNSYQGLLLETAQAIDEASVNNVASPQGQAKQGTEASTSPLAPLARVEGVEFVLTLHPDATKGFDAWGVENPKPLADWARDTLARFAQVGDRMLGAQLAEIECVGLQRHIAIVQRRDGALCVGWQRNLSIDQVRDNMKKVVAKWAS